MLKIGDKSNYKWKNYNWIIYSTKYKVIKINTQSLNSEEVLGSLQSSRGSVLHYIDLNKVTSTYLFTYAYTK